MDTMQRDSNKKREISFYKLTLESLPEMWMFQILAAVIFAIPVMALTELMHFSAGIGGEIVTTANIKEFIFSWKFLLTLILGISLVLIYITVELFALIFLTDSILKGEKAGLRKCIASGFKSLKSFANATGILIILFIFIAAPLCGSAFAISLSQSFYIPNFIMEVVFKNPLFTFGYLVLIVFFYIVAYRGGFVMHAVLLDKMTPKEGIKYSFRIEKENRFTLLKRIIPNALIIVTIIGISKIIFSKIPGLLLGGLAEKMSKNHNIDAKVIAYRSLIVFLVFGWQYLVYIVTLLCGSYFMLLINRYYLEFTKRGSELWPERPNKAGNAGKVLFLIGTFVFIAIVSVIYGFNFSNIFGRKEPVKIIAHRAGGTMASENSLEGIKKAIEHGCYGSEIDVQRTKDGYYIINHDNDFARLTGVSKAPMDMTIDEIKELRIQDTTGNGQELPVVTFEEMLDASKGKIKLFVELKGTTADHQMVDDVVRIIKEHDCIEDTALISLDYDVIDYAETNYPEFETGTLFFAGLGDFSKLNCDLIILEEEIATLENIYFIHKAGKQAIAWTVNTGEGMYKFLDSIVDVVITDEILLSEEVQSLLDNRTDLEIVEDELIVIQ
ncbi:MAG: glycerophosphoryl diester phosphodiesterase membrane domain-containing protein [Lachnospiraceae bacterium]|nr:glycerophosphoryl diester phosphodiesterase membrane domain-containing protein [Lachnospiraceae bacterium]